MGPRVSRLFGHLPVPLINPLLQMATLEAGASAGNMMRDADLGSPTYPGGAVGGVLGVLVGGFALSSAGKCGLNLGHVFIHFRSTGLLHFGGEIQFLLFSFYSGT